LFEKSFAVTAKCFASESFFPCGAARRYSRQPARGGKVKAGTQSAQPVGVEAFTLSSRAVSKKLRRAVQRGKVFAEKNFNFSPVVSPERLIFNGEAIYSDLA